MTTYLVAALVTLAFTIVLTVAGLGAAFILVPVYLALGVSMHSAQATALLLNAIAMAFACARFIPASSSTSASPYPSSSWPPCFHRWARTRVRSCRSRHSSGCSSDFWCSPR